MQDPQTAVLDLIYGRWRSQTLYAGVRLGIFEALSSGTKDAAAVAGELGLVPEFAYRLLRALSSLGLLHEHPDRGFSLTETGELLGSDQPQSLRGVALLTEGPEHYAVWKHLPEIVRDGPPNGFVREFGEPAFDHAAHTPSYEEAFDNGMSSYSTVQTEWTLGALQGCDLSKVSRACDVGRGQGHLLCHLLLRYPHMTGAVLDRAAVFEKAGALWADTLHVRDRCEYVPGDMFADVPAADAYFLKMILHDWNDEECIAILRTIHRHASGAGRIFIVEHVIPEANVPHTAKLFDLHMLCWGTGRERTAQEYAALLAAAGWRFLGLRLPSHGTLVVVEGEKV